jgi:hypothetical protein
VGEIRTVFGEWDIHVASAGRLSPWDGGPLFQTLEQNNLWCRRNAGEPWCLDIAISEGDQKDWIYRRDHTFRVNWDEAVLHSPEGIPYLAPDLQLLFKSKNVRPKDVEDVRHVIPSLTPERRRRVMEHLPQGHPWQEFD